MSPPSPPDPPASGGCAIGELFEILGRAHTLRILHLFLTDPGRPLRFVDLQQRLRLSPNTVSERLKGLVSAGLLRREVFHELPPRVEYSATPKLVELGTVFQQLDGWVQRNDLSPVPGAGGIARSSRAPGMRPPGASPTSSRN